MFKLLLSVAFLVISAVLFFMYTKPAYSELAQKKQVMEKYANLQEKIVQASSIKSEKINKSNNINPALRQKLDKMLPANTIDNIQLILDIEGIASKNRVKLSKVDIGNAEARSQTQEEQHIVPVNVGARKSDALKEAELGFEFIASYDDFIRFLLDLEHSVRIVDIVELSFKSDSSDGQTDSGNNFDTFSGSAFADDSESPQGVLTSDVYRFKMRIKTYWVDIQK